MTAEEVTRLNRRPVMLRLAGRDDVSVLAAAMARALARDPLLRWLAPGQRQRERVLAAHLKLAVPYETVFSTGNREGAAVWFPPGAWRTSLLSQLARLPQIVGSVGLKQLPLRMHGLQVLAARHPRLPHYYLGQFAIDPAVQNRGVGTALLKPMLRVCDGEQVGAYLETANRDVLPFFLRHGFMVTDTVQLPAGGPSVWLMWRPPAEP
ncbi:hypothetical protein CAI21_04450 [Alkalilimnicola ehrlichii]|uniref:N-acetyltransferase domain-containing protein n=1 Tax=Alkalilimnicola ehrlichii TaxID=351052 RepID=A0A3E0X232_9GAMM|nr:GNAT family N-acetyltransferase [Alkalilimnicola ehrlichii]RFA30765.1 hypothetical protein CAI21_04450 [Alkalilimnicola ehrlichii]RFA38341.1 hypothetical protein CAL65_05815 [Alkalilimnicola ehrlichii]